MSSVAWTPYGDVEKSVFEQWDSYKRVVKYLDENQSVAFNGVIPHVVGCCSWCGKCDGIPLNTHHNGSKINGNLCWNCYCSI